MATQAANLFVAIGADVSSALSGIRRVESAVGGMGGFIKSAAGNALGFVAATAGMNAFGSAADVARGAIIGMNSTLETQGIAFRTLLGSQEASAAMLGELQRFANSTDLTFPQVATAAQRFLGAGVAAKDIIPLIRDVAGTSAAFGAGAEGVDRITRALQQMKSTGVVQLGEMNQLAELGVNAFDILAQHTGKSVQQIRKQLEGGKIRPEEFFAAFQANARRRGFDVVLAEQSKTLTGALSTIGDTLNSAGARAFLPLFELAREGANAFVAFTDTAAFAGFVERIRTGVQGIAQEIGTFVATTQNIASAHGLNLFDAALVALELRMGEVFGPESQAKFHAFVSDLRTGFDWLITNAPGAFDWVKTTGVPAILSIGSAFASVTADIQKFKAELKIIPDRIMADLDRFDAWLRTPIKPNGPTTRLAEQGTSILGNQHFQAGALGSPPVIPVQFPEGAAVFGQRAITYAAPLVNVETVNASDPADVDAFLDRVAAELISSQRAAENTAPAELPGN